jgi:biopolymer transport protein ExbD
MRLKKTSKRAQSTLHELNITPLLDLVFVLLVIFIITTPQMMNNLEMTLPSPKPPPPTQEKPKLNRIAVAASGQVTLNGQNVTVSELKTGLQTLKASDPDLKVVVQGADEADYQAMVAILDVLRQLNITKVGLATE